jgi:hypothetical protein
MQLQVLKQIQKAYRLLTKPTRTRTNFPHKKSWQKVISQL